MIEKHQLIVSKIRREIVSGKYDPNDRLPTSRELAARFKASSVTVNRALSVLIRDGYIRTSGRHGTFVASHPPHLCQYGLVCPGPESARTPFVSSIFQASRKFRRSNSRRVVRYWAENLHRQVGMYQRLADDVQCQRLAGLICVSKPSALAGSPIWEKSNLTRVVIAQGRIEDPNGVPVIQQDYSHFAEEAARIFFEGGKLKIAGLFSPQTFDPGANLITNTLGELGVAARDEWMQVIHPEYPESIERVIALMMSSSERPDGLVIFDDVLTGHAVNALQRLGISMPGQMQVVSYCSSKEPIDGTLPVEQICHDQSDLISQAFDVIDRIRLGETVDQPTEVANAVAEEVAQ